MSWEVVAQELQVAKFEPANDLERVLAQKIIELKQHLDSDHKDLVRPDCMNCGGSGWYQEATEGGDTVRCHCWAIYAHKLKEERDHFARQNMEWSKTADYWKQIAESKPVSSYDVVRHPTGQGSE